MKELTVTRCLCSSWAGLGLATVGQSFFLCPLPFSFFFLFSFQESSSLSGFVLLTGGGQVLGTPLGTLQGSGSFGFGSVEREGEKLDQVVAQLAVKGLGRGL